MKQFLEYANALTKYSLLPTLVLSAVLIFSISSSWGVILIYFSAVFVISHALHLTIAFRASKPEKISSSAMLAVGVKFIVILIGSVAFLFLMDVDNIGLLIIVVLYIYYMIVSAKFFYEN